MSSKILVVGAGGLGCELLKLLTRERTYRITVIDEDSIDATNLNRQFLFTREDVGGSKAACAARKLKHKHWSSDEGAESGCGLEILALHDRVQRYKRIGFYKEFDVVFNCLDNNETRSFVNQRCNLAGVLMIDGGSAGWLGQSFYSGGECFDCLPPKVEAVLPQCTIRQRPTEFRHCLAWARAIVKDKDGASFYEDMLCAAPEDACAPANPPVPDMGSGEVLEEKEQAAAAATSSTRPVKVSQASAWSAQCPSSKENVTNGRCRDDIGASCPGSAHLPPSKTNRKRQKTDAVSSEASSGGLSSHMGLAEINLECANALALPGPFFDLDYYAEQIRNTADGQETHLIYRLAILKAAKHGIRAMPFFESQQLISNIIPSVCTTNSMIAALMIVSARNKTNYFLVQSVSRFVAMSLNPSSTRCLTCSVPVYFCRFSGSLTMRDVMARFGARSAVTDTTFHDALSDSPLSDLDGEFAIVYRGELPFRFYFENSSVEDGRLDITRIK